MSTNGHELIFWLFISPFINPNKKTKISPLLILKNTSSNSVQELTTVFCNFFSSTVTQFTFKPYNTCLNYIKNFTGDKSNLSFRYLQGASKFKLEQFTESEVLKALSGLDESSGMGSTNISPKVLKYCAEELARPITKLFNLCLSSGNIPDEWKIAHITPVYKGKGAKSDINNYRPISILSPIAKVFESLIADRITNYLESNCLLHDAQYGYRRG